MQTKLSVVLRGTPNPFTRLLGKARNGKRGTDVLPLFRLFNHYKLYHSCIELSSVILYK